MKQEAQAMTHHRAVGCELSASTLVRLKVCFVEERANHGVSLATGRSASFEMGTFFVRTRGSSGRKEM